VYPHLAKKETAGFESFDNRTKQPPVKMIEQHDQIEFFTLKVIVSYIATVQV
jgi:hypothetical protein